MIDYSYLDVAIILIVVSLICLFIMIINTKEKSNNNTKKDLNNNTVNYNANKNLDDYIIGDYILGIRIEAILSQNGNLLVYLNENNGIGFSFADLTTIPKHMEKLNYYYKLQSKIDLENFSHKDLNTLNGSLGASLGRAMVDRSGENIKDSFNDTKFLVKKYIKNIQEIRHGYFTLSNIILGVLSCFILITLYYQLEWVHASAFIMSAGGILGSIISVIQRNKETKYVHFKSLPNILLFSSVSTILGGITGFILYWVNDAGIIIGHSADNLSTLLILSIVAGSSERYLNNMLKKQEKSSVK